MRVPPALLTNPALEPALDILFDVLLTTKEVARRLRLTPCYMRLLRMKGLGPEFLKTDSGAVRYRMSAVLRYELEAEANGRQT